MNPENYCNPHRHRLLSQTTKQPLSNFETQKPWKYQQLCGQGLILLVYKKVLLLECYYVADLILDSIQIILAFNVNFVHLGFFFTLHILKCFCHRMNKPIIHINIIGSISSFQNGPDNLFSSSGFYFKSKIIKDSHKEKVMFLNFWTLFFQNVHF